MRPGFNLWVGKIPWRRNWQPTPVLLPGEVHGERSLAGYSSWDCKELDTTEILSHMHMGSKWFWKWLMLWRGSWSETVKRLEKTTPASDCRAHMPSHEDWLDSEHAQSQSKTLNTDAPEGGEHHLHTKHRQHISGAWWVADAKIIW